MNLIDLLILVLLMLAIVRGVQAGLLQLLFSSLGFVGGLLLGSWIAKALAVHFSGPGAKLAMILIIEFGLAFTLAAAGEIAGIYAASKATHLHLGKLNKVLGAGLEGLILLLVVWMTASALVNVSSYNLGPQIRQSWILSKMNAVLPRPPDVFAQLEKIISPNGFPNVFVGLEPEHTTVAPTNKVNNKAVLAAEKSVVKIRGVGCGGIITGSGFVVDKSIVVTNAHVVAGILNPRVVDASGTWPSTVIWFDPNLDVAVLKVRGLPDLPLKLASGVLPNYYAAATLGFPGGGPLVAENAVIIDHVTATGRNIYNRGIVLRGIYEFQAKIEHGDSGGPLLAPSGEVAGVVFGKSVTQNNVGYALLIDQLKQLISQAKQQNTPVNTHSCAAD